jgi:hypothetical protein
VAPCADCLLALLSFLSPAILMSLTDRAPAIDRPAPDGDGRRAARFTADVERHLARNIAGQLAHGALGQTGFRLFQAPTFFPTYMFLLSGSELVVGLARSVQRSARSSRRCSAPR